MLLKIAVGLSMNDPATSMRTSRWRAPYVYLMLGNLSAILYGLGNSQGPGNLDPVAARFIKFEAL